MKDKADLSNPACPECCVKHLLAAAALMRTGEHAVDKGVPLLGAALVVLGEYATGDYPEHRLLAAGYLAAAETLYPLHADDARKLRKELALNTLGDDGLQDGMEDVIEWLRDAVTVKDVAVGHLMEAVREAPQDAVQNIKHLGVDDDLMRAAMSIAATYELYGQGTKAKEDK